MTSTDSGVLQGACIQTTDQSAKRLFKRLRKAAGSQTSAFLLLLVSPASPTLRCTPVDASVNKSSKGTRFFQTKPNVILDSSSLISEWYSPVSAAEQCKPGPGTQLKLLGQTKPVEKFVVLYHLEPQESRECGRRWGGDIKQHCLNQSLKFRGFP